MFTQKLNTLTPGSNFQIFYAAFTQRNLGVVSSTLLVTLNHLQINMFLFQSFYQAFPIDQAVLEVLDDLTHYFYMGNIIELNKTLYYAFRIIAWIISISYFLVYLLMQLCFHKNYRIQSLERLFTLYNTYYANLLLLPSMEILFKEVVCDQTILEPLDQECLAGVHIFVFVISFLSILAGLGMSFLSIFYSQNGIYDKKNYLSGENRGYEGSIALIKAILGVTVTIQNNSTALEQVYYVVNLATSLAIVLYFGYFFPYNKLFIEQVTLFWLAVYLAQSVAMVISCFTDITDLMAGLPFLGFLIATVIGLNFLYKQRKDSLIFKPTVSSNSELQKKVQNILQLKQSDRLQTNQELYFRGVVSTHMTSCIDPGCFCKKSELFDPKKNKNLELEKWGMYKSMTLKYYVSFLFEQQIQKGGSDPDLLIAYAQFLFEKFRNTHLALTQIIKVTNAGIFLYPHQRNKIFKIRRRIYEYVSARNQEALEVSLGIEDAIFVEDQFHSVLDQMRKIMQASIGFWGYLSGKEVDLDQMQVLVETLTKSVETANVMWGPLKPYLHKNKKVMFYYNWYLKEFLNKRVMLSEEGVDELFDDEKCSIHSQDFISLIPNDNLIFHDDTPIVHMSGNYTDLGKIIKVNKATLNVFGYTRDELERASVNILMPKITAQRHNYYLECFAKTGRSKTLYTQKKTFAKDKEGYIFRLWIIVKQLNNLQGLIQYVGILRPMSEKKDGHNYYMQFNDYGEVGGVCRNFASYFSQIEPQFQNKRFNLVIFAPKLIKYLFFRQFMLDQKEKELGFDQAQSPNSKYGILDAETDSPGGLRLQDTPKSASMKKKKKNAAENNDNRLYELQDFLDLDALPEDEEEKDNESDQEKAVVFTSKNEKIIEFTFRIPSKSDVWIKEFDELKTRPQTLVNSHHLGENKLLIMNSFDSSRSLLERPPGEAIRPAAVTAFSSSKHAFDSYLTALKIVSHKIAKAKNSHVYKMKAVLGVDKNGPDDDIVKYLKITEIQKVSHRKTTIDSSNQSPDKNKEFRSFNSNGSFSEVQKEVHKEHRDPTERRQKRDLSVKPIKMSLFSNNRGDNLVIKKIDVSDIESMESDNETAALENGERPSKHSKLEQKEIVDDDASDGENSEITPRSKSSKGDDKENGSQGSSESIKQAVITELKNTLITQFQSMYQKEENMLIDKDCRSLRRLRWCTYLLFLTIIPINLIFFLVSTNNAFSHLDDAVTDVYTNEKLRKDFLSAHDAILTLLLNNTDGFANITTVSMSEIDELVDSEITVIDTTHDEIAALAPQDQWTEVLYKYAPLVEQNAVLNYADNYEFSQQTTTIQIAFWKLANSLEDITLYNISDFQQDDTELIFYRWNCLPMFNDVFYRTSVKLFASISSSFDNTKSLAIWCLVTEGVTLVASLVIIFVLVTVVTQSLKEILLSFTAIDNQSIRETEAYYKRLLNFFNISQAKYVENDSSKIPIKNNTNSGMLAKQNTNTNKFEKKFKKVLEKTFMKNYTRKILAYYVVATIICIVMLGVFDIEIHSTLSYADTMLSDVQQIVKLNTVYITSLIGLKSIFLNTTAYQEVTQGFMSGTIAVLDTTLNTSSIQSTSSFGDLARIVYGGKICDTLTSLFSNDEEIEECRSLVLGKLSTGLVSFHNYYGNLVVPALELTDPTFGIIDIDSIYEFGELIKIIDSVLFDTLLESWKGDMESYMDSQSRVLTVLIIVLNLVNAIIFYWAQRGVLKSLNTKFLFYRKVYNRYMLADALIKEKRIKARLMKFRLLNK